jgi:hypothetical protein
VAAETAYPTVLSFITPKEKHKSLSFLKRDFFLKENVYRMFQEK